MISWGVIANYVTHAACKRGRSGWLTGGQAVNHGPAHAYLSMMTNSLESAHNLSAVWIFEHKAWVNHANQIPAPSGHTPTKPAGVPRGLSRSSKMTIKISIKICQLKISLLVGLVTRLH